jgi:ribosomal protein S12 methylthiotransferase
MCRADTKEHTVELVEKIRNRMPEAVLRTTVIVGYPGETDAQFEELLDFVRWAKFDALGCFRFSPEPGTAAAELSDQLPESVKQQRADTLMKLQQQIAFDRMDARIGKEYRILVDEIYEQQAIGRFYGQAPHIDSICTITDPSVPYGAFIQAKVTARDGYDLVVEPL